jgi:hypothetical protein
MVLKSSYINQNPNDSTAFHKIVQYYVSQNFVQQFSVITSTQVGTDFNRKAAGMQSSAKINFPVITAKEYRVEGKESLQPITGWSVQKPSKYT